MDTRFDPMLAKLIAGGRDASRSTGEPRRGPRTDAGPGPRDQPALPALARGPAGGDRWGGPDRHARADLAAEGRRRGDGSPTAGGLAGRRAGPGGNDRRRLALERTGPPPARMRRRGADDRRSASRPRTNSRRSLSSTTRASRSLMTTAGACRSGSRHRPTWIEPLGPPPGTARAGSPRSAPRCRVPCWRFMSLPA